MKLKLLVDIRERLETWEIDKRRQYCVNFTVLCSWIAVFQRTSIQIRPTVMIEHRC